MIRKVCSAIAAVLLLSSAVYSDTAAESISGDSKTAIPSYSTDMSGLEVGGLLGIPSGFTMRYWFNDMFALELTTGFSLDSEPLMGLDFVYKPFGIFHAATWNLYFTIGAGFMASYMGNEADYIARVPIGFTVPLDYYPVQFTLYGAPAIVLNRPEEKKIQWGLAVTYSFSRGEHLFNKREQAIYQNLKLKGEVEGLKSGLDQTKGQLSMTELDLEKTRGRLSTTENELNSIKGELTSTKNDLTQLQSALTSTRGELATAQTTLDTFKLRLDGAKEELNRTNQKLNEKDRELNRSQEDLDKAREIIKEALEGKEREEEEKNILQRQIQLDKEFKRLKEEKISLKKGNEQESEARSAWKDKCTARRGVVNSDGECVCRVGETWNADKSACVCVSGYTFDKKSDRCEPCEIVSLSGACLSGCDEDERKVAMKKGPHSFVCVKRCRGKNEVWIKSSGRCGCDEGYTYDSNNKCVPRR